MDKNGQFQPYQILRWGEWTSPGGHGGAQGEALHVGEAVPQLVPEVGQRSLDTAIHEWTEWTWPNLLVTINQIFAMVVKKYSFELFKSLEKC